MGAVILAAVAGVAAKAVVVVLIVVAALVYVSMAHHLKKHLDCGQRRQRQTAVMGLVPTPPNVAAA